MLDFHELLFLIAEFKRDYWIRITFRLLLTGYDVQIRGRKMGPGMSYTFRTYGTVVVWSQHFTYIAHLKARWCALENGGFFDLMGPSLQ